MDASFPPEFQGSPSICAVDFDGVLHDDRLGFLDGTCYGEVIPGSEEALRFLASKFVVVIYTAKARKDRPLVSGKTGAELVWEWLERHGLRSFVTDVTAEKPRATIYIDDRAVRFEDWAKTIEQLKNLKAV